MSDELRDVVARLRVLERAIRQSGWSVDPVVNHGTFWSEATIHRGARGVGVPAIAVSDKPDTAKDVATFIVEARNHMPTLLSALEQMFAREDDVAALRRSMREVEDARHEDQVRHAEEADHLRLENAALRTKLGQ